MDNDLPFVNHAVQQSGAARLDSVPPEPQSDTLTAEAIAVQTIEQNADLAKKYAGGDMAVLDTLTQKAIALAAGRVGEHEIKDTLMRKLGASI